jgi:hypothetical protein
MPALLPIIVASTHLVLAADRVPTLNIEPSCRAAVSSAAIAGRDENSCKQDELAARGRLEQDWGQYSARERSHCTQLSTLGGAPSYVELLTCLELSRDARTMETDPMSNERIER